MLHELEMKRREENANNLLFAMKLRVPWFLWDGMVIPRQVVGLVACWRGQCGSHQKYHCGRLLVFA